MTTKTFELTLDERELMCRVLQHCMETNAECNLKYDVTHKYVWVTPEDKQEQEDMKALHAKLEIPEPIKKVGWVGLYPEDEDGMPSMDGAYMTEKEARYNCPGASKFVRVTWEEVG